MSEEDTFAEGALLQVLKSHFILVAKQQVPIDLIVAQEDQVRRLHLPPACIAGHARRHGAKVLDLSLSQRAGGFRHRAGLVELDLLRGSVRCLLRLCQVSDGRLRDSSTDGYGTRMNLSPGPRGLAAPGPRVALDIPLRGRAGRDSGRRGRQEIRR